MPVSELASVDGAISPTAEATIPVKDDGLYRGDGVFEVIRLYGGRPFALVDAPRPARALGSGDLAAGSTAPTLEREIEALLEAAATRDAQLRLIVTRGGRRIAADSSRSPRTPRRVSLATVTYAPTRHPHRRQVALLRRQHAGDPARQGAAAPTRRCWCGPTASCSRRRPRRSSGSRRRAALRTPALDAGDPRVDHPRARSMRGAARRGGRVPGRGPAAAPARRSSPRPSARSRPSRRSTAARARGARRRATREAPEAFAVAGRAPATAGSSAVDFDLTDEQRLIQETAREFADNEIVPRARENDRAERFDLELAQQARRDGLPRRAGRRGVRRPRPRLHQLRADRRGDRARRLLRRAPSSPSRPRSSAARSSAGAPRSRSSAGCRGSARASRSAASG